MIVVVKPKTTTITVTPDNTDVLVNSPIKTLEGLTDVHIGALSTLAENDILKYANGEWVNSPVGADASFTYNQSTASAVWTITHNLGKYPNVVVIDSANDEVEGNISYPSNLQMIITFSAAFSGTAYLN